MKPVSSNNIDHTAEAAALGFYYQAFYALLTLLDQTTDNAAVGVEQLDDVMLTADGHNLLYQLKHSIVAKPQPISLKSRSFWKTIKVWTDLIPNLSISETTFHLVTVASLLKGTSLKALTSPEEDRSKLVKEMRVEAERIIQERVKAKKNNEALPYADRYKGCEAFLQLSDTQQLNLMKRVNIKEDAPDITKVEGLIASHDKLTTLPCEHRASVAIRLIEWWDRQILYSMCDKRQRTISHTELQYQFANIVADIEQQKLTPDFETIIPPKDYQPDGMLYRQIELVKGKPSDHTKAIREEWRAREQRSKWLNENPAMASTIEDYDLILKEHWSDRHSTISEDCDGLDDKEKCKSGLEILRWTHDKSPTEIRPISKDWDAAYYVRGSYQVLAIDQEVGWHPDYAKLLEEAE